MPDTTQWIGIAASIGTGVALLPQLIKLVREKKAENVSMGMMVTLLTGLVLWVIYGILMSDPIIIVSNAFSLVLNVFIIVLGAYYKKKTSTSTPTATPNA